MSAENKKSLTAVWISLISNILLTILKLVVGFMAKSQVLIADGVHNAGDVIATGTALLSMRISKLPADEDHPYGHGKAEVLGAGAVAIILALAALYIAYQSIMALFEPAQEATVLALIVAAVSLIWKQVLYAYTIRLGKKINSKGLLATAYDHLADVYASLAAVLGIGLALLGDHYQLLLFSYGDPLAGTIVSYFVLKLAWDMGRDAVDVLMEKNVSQEQLDQYIAVIEEVPQVKRIDRIRAREHGHYIMIDIRIGVLADYTIQEGHDVANKLKHVIMERFSNVAEVFIHLNPYYGEEVEKGSKFK